jgi:hypothetical protein
MDRYAVRRYPSNYDFPISTLFWGAVIFLALVVLCLLILKTIAWLGHPKGSRDHAISRPGGKAKCPDCAETIQADAKVCKHCGYRFTQAQKTRAMDAEKTPTSEVRLRTSASCFKCQHEMTVPVNQLDFVCEACGTKLRRKMHI